MSGIGTRGSQCKNNNGQKNAITSHNCCFETSNLSIPEKRRILFSSIKSYIYKSKLNYPLMKPHFIIAFILFSLNSVYAQALFEDESSVISYMDQKTFQNAENGLEVSYGYLSIYNTYGIKVRNKNGAIFYFVNCSIDAYGNFADIFGMNPEDGSDFGFRVYPRKLVVGRGEEGETTFILKN
jgi:hypothetical protein